MKNNNNNLFFQLIRKFVFSKFFEHNRLFHGLRKRESRTLYRRRRREKKRKEGKKRKQQKLRGVYRQIFALVTGYRNRKSSVRAATRGYIPYRKTWRT